MGMESLRPVINEIEMTEIPTKFLQEKLNKFYNLLRTTPKDPSSSGLFDYLWDLKELALVNHEDTIDIPSKWLVQLDERIDEDVRKH
jgi:hypothetical protein